MQHKQHLEQVSFHQPRHSLIRLQQLLLIEACGIDVFAAALFGLLQTFVFLSRSRHLEPFPFIFPARQYLEMHFPPSIYNPGDGEIWLASFGIYS